MLDLPQNITLLRADQIRVAPENPRIRCIDEAKILELANNILEHGILTPLIGYMDDDKFYAVAGGRRTRAIETMLASAKIGNDYPVPVRIVERGDAPTLGIAEQLTHQQLSDLDEVWVYAQPQFHDKTDAELAKIIGKSVKAVTQRRAVLSLPDEIKDAMWEGKITVEQAHGLTYFLQDDEALADAFDDCVRNPRITLTDLRDSFERGCREWERDPRTQIVTREEYIEAGGKLQGDLFTESSFILTPSVLETVARAKAEDHLIAEFPDAAFILHIDFMPERRTWAGLDRLTDEEREEWDDIRWDRWQHDKDEEPEWFERYDELEAKAERFIPDEAKPYLGVTFSLNSRGNTAIHSTINVLPDDPHVIEIFYEKGWLKRPAEPSDNTGEAASDEPDPLALSQKMVDFIRRIRLQVARNRLILKPDLAMAHYLVHVQSHSSWDFTYLPEPSNQLPPELEDAFEDGKKWLEAKALMETPPDEVFNLTAAKIKALMAYRILDCMGAKPSFVDDYAENPREFFTPTVEFLKGYSKPQLLAMIADWEGDFANQKKSALVDMLADHAKDNEGWLPLGFL